MTQKKRGTAKKSTVKMPHTGKQMPMKPPKRMPRHK